MWFHTRQHLQQGRFSGSIRTDQPKAFPIADMEVQIGEQSTDAEVLGCTHQADQAHDGVSGNYLTR